MGTLAKRTRLFDLGVAAVEQSVLVKAADGTIIRDAYPCPLCMTFFRREAIADHLTIEHVPAASVGGRPLVLTCKTCNNRSGTSHERELAKHHRLKQALSGDGSIRVTVDGVNARMELRPNEVYLAVDTKHTDPTQAHQWFADVEEGKALFEIAGDLRDIPIERSVRLSMLRSAFLAVFALHGYRHILGSAYLPFRRQLRDLDEVVIETMPVLSKPEWPSGIREARHAAIGPSLMFGWNEWRVLLPRDPDDGPWLARFTTEHLANTSMVGARQDQQHLPVRPLHLLDFASSVEGELQPIELF